MRKVRDYDAELKALGDKAKVIKSRRVEQLGHLVAATGADTLDVETLAGALLYAVALADTKTKEAWRAKGDAFFRRRGRKNGTPAQINGSGADAEQGNDTAGGSGTASDG